MYLTEETSSTAMEERAGQGNSVLMKIKMFWPDGLLFADLLVLFCLVGVACIYEIWPEGDPLEHIYASYRVALGDVPYRDFFEHHHGLLWYIAAPIVRLMARNTAVYEVLNYLTFLFFSYGLYFVYRTIRDFIGGRTAGLIAIVFLLVPNIFVYYVYFKPDNWMFTGISGGIYYCFKYFSEKKRWMLAVSFLFFFLAFALCQKALFYFPIIGLAVLWSLYKKEMRVRDFVDALILPLVLFFSIIGYFYSQDALKDYFLLNFKFNSGMIKFFGEHRVSEPDGWLALVIYAGVIVSLVCYKLENWYFRLYSLIFLSIFLQRKFYFSPYIYYWYEVYYFAVPLVSSAIIKLMGQKRILLYLVVLEMQFYVGYMASGLYSSFALREKVRTTPDFRMAVIAHTNPCDEVVSFGSNISSFNSYPMYYWFLLGHVDVLGEKLGFHKVENLNKIIEERLPKVIYVSEVKERYAEDPENPPVIHKPDMEMIKKYYYPSVFSSDEGELDFATLQFQKNDYPQGIWFLKKKWRKNNCLFDKENGRWYYADEN